MGGERNPKYCYLSMQFIKACRKKIMINYCFFFFFLSSVFLPFCFYCLGAATLLEIWGLKTQVRRTLAVRLWPFVPLSRSFGSSGNTLLTLNHKELTEQGLPRWVHPVLGVESFLKNAFLRLFCQGTSVHQYHSEIVFFCVVKFF